MHVHRAPAVPIALALSGRNHKMVKGDGITMIVVLAIIALSVVVGLIIYEYRGLKR